MRKVIHILALVSAIPLSCCAALIWAWSDPSPVPLTKDLPRETEAKRPAFEARVKAAFPIGTPTEKVERELKHQRFIVEALPNKRDDLHMFKRYDGGAPACDLEASVFLKSDNNGLLAEIQGVYKVTCL